MVQEVRHQAGDAALLSESSTIWGSRSTGARSRWWVQVTQPVLKDDAGSVVKRG